MATNDGGGMELRDYLSVLRRRKRMIILATLTVVASAVVLSMLQEPVYRAKARVLIRPDSAVFGNTSGLPTDPAFIETQMVVIESKPVRDLVQEKLGPVPEPSTTAVGTTSVVQVAVESRRPERAAEVTNAYVDAYLAFRSKQLSDALSVQTREIQSKIDALQKQIDDLGNQINALAACGGQSGVCPQRESLQQDRDALISQQVPFKQRRDELQVEASAGGAPAQVVTPAAVPDEPVRPTPVRNALAALAVGLVLGTTAALAFEHLDDSIKSKEDLQRSARDIPVLGMIPTTPGWKERDRPRVVSLLEPSSPSAEAYRTLRTSIRFLAVDRPLRVIQVTSPAAGEGKTTTTANLAVALARAGERVVIVSCDLRRPRLHEFFGLTNSVGFTSVLLGEVPLSSALQPVPEVGRLWVLPSGPLPPNPSELLSSTRASEVLNGLQASADTVLVDCPPVLPVTDAAVLSGKVDGTLLVVTAGDTTRKQMARTVELLRQVNAPLVGAVLNNAPAEGAYTYLYRYYEQEPLHARPPSNGKVARRNQRERVEATNPGTGTPPNE